MICLEYTSQPDSSPGFEFPSRSMLLEDLDVFLLFFLGGCTRSVLEIGRWAPCSPRGTGESMRTYRGPGLWVMKSPWVWSWRSLFIVYVTPWLLEIRVEPPGSFNELNDFVQVYHVHDFRWARIEGVKELTSQHCPLGAFAYVVVYRFILLLAEGARFTYDVRFVL